MTAARVLTLSGVAAGVVAIMTVWPVAANHANGDAPARFAWQGRSGICSRQCLTALADRYLESLVMHDPSRLPLTPSVRLTENGRELKLGDGLWQTASSLGSYRVYVLDPDGNAVAVQAVVHEGSAVGQILLRLEVHGERISEIETLVARRGDTCCWAPERLDGLPPIFGQAVPAAERSTRQDLVVTGDAYFTALHTAGTREYRRTPLGEGMNRYENGQQTTNVVANANRVTRWDAQTQLDSALFGAIRVVNRRYPVVDTQNGTMLGIVVFRYPGSDRPPEIISEVFKITRGKIREIRAVMVTRASTGWD
jgi:hypothetical protein